MTECPACGGKYSAHTEIRSGDRHQDVFPAPPYTTFKKYARVCVDPEDYQYSKGGSYHPVNVYLHTMTDLRSDAPPPVGSSGGGSSP